MSLTRDPNKGGSSSGDELRLTLGEHLDELRTRLVRIVLLLAIGMAAGWPLVVPVHNAMLSRVEMALPAGFQWEPVWSSLTAPFLFQLKMSFTLGLLVTLPLTVWQLWGFVSPGLRPHERRPFQIVVPLSVLLFFVGAGLGWLVLPPTFGWFATMALQFPDVKVLQNPADVVFFSSKMMLAFGVGFQLPLLVFFAARLGLITPETVTRYWRHAAVGVFLVTAVITPSGDPISMMVMALPLTLLTFGSIGAARLTMRGREAKDDVLNNLD